MRLLRRALLLLGLLAGLFAMHGLAPAAGTDVLAAGPHQHPVALLAAGPTDAGTAALSAPAVTDQGMPGEAMRGEAMPGGAMPGGAMRGEAMPARSGSPSPGHGGHGSHLDGLCLAVLASSVAFLLALALPALLGRRGSGSAVPAVLHRLGHAGTSVSPLRPPDLARLCVLRI